MPHSETISGLWNTLPLWLRVGLLLFVIVGAMASSWITATYTYRASSEELMVERGSQEFIRMDRLLVIFAERIEDYEERFRRQEARIRELERQCASWSPSNTRQLSAPCGHSDEEHSFLRFTDTSPMKPRTPFEELMISPDEQPDTPKQ